MSARTFPDFTVIPHFKASEFACKCLLCRGGMPTLDLLQSLDALRTEWNAPLRIVSGLRCPRWNAIHGGTETSLHLTGRAVDLAGEGIHCVKFIRFAIYAGFTGIGEGEWTNDDGSISRILHLDRRRPGGEPYFWVALQRQLFRPVSWTYKGWGVRVPGNELVNAAWREITGRE